MFNNALQPIDTLFISLSFVLYVHSCYSGWTIEGKSVKHTKHEQFQHRINSIAGYGGIIMSIWSSSISFVFTIILSFVAIAVFVKCIMMFFRFFFCVSVFGNVYVRICELMALDCWLVLENSLLAIPAAQPHLVEHRPHKLIRENFTHSRINFTHRTSMVFFFTFGIAILHWLLPLV